ncbi:MAG: hypothetical protein DRJ56_02680 [Thermoprotei archaeon]|nr:MAG: hypothetical protein DRJ56_02680 [Thermoprotei archaeon]
MATEAKPEKEVVAKGITVKSLTVSAIICIITYAIFLYSFHPRVAGVDWAWFTHYMVYLGWRWYFGWETLLFPLIIIVSLLSLLSRKIALSKQEWTIVYSIATIVVPSTFWWGIWAWCMNGMLGTERFKHLIEYIPSAWVPKDYDILAAYYESRKPWEWTIPHAGAWTTPIVMWVLFYVIVNIMLYGLVLVFVRRMIIVEKLPYPVTTTTLTVINYATEPVSGGVRTLLWSKKGLLFWIGFLIGVFFEVFSLFPGWIWKKPPFTIPDEIPLQGKYPPFQRSVLSHFIHPSHVGLYFLFSLDILFTAVLFHVIFLILLPAVFVSTGVFPPKAESEWGAMWGIYFRHQWGFAGTYAYALNAMTIGIALYLLWYTRSDWIASFKRFLKGAEAEEGEPVSPRVAWSLLLGGAILFLIWMAASEIHIVGSIVALLYILVIWFAVLRFAGEAWSCPQLPWGFRLQQYDRQLAYALATALTGSGANPTGYGLAYVISNLTCYQPHSSVVPGIFSYKMAYETKTDFKEVFKAQIVTIVLASILSVVIGWYTRGVQGLSNWRHGWTTSWDGALNNGLGAANDVTRRKEPYPDMFTISAFVGIVVGAVLMFLRTTFPWFIINPIGVPLLSLLNFYTSWSAIVAFIIKLLVVKIGGLKAYEYAVPIAVGGFLGSLLMWEIGYPMVLWLRFGLRWIPI